MPKDLKEGKYSCFCPVNEEIGFDNRINENHVSLGWVCGPGIEKKPKTTNKTDALIMTGFWFKDSSPAVYNSQKVKVRGSQVSMKQQGIQHCATAFPNWMYIEALPNQMIANNVCNEKLIESCCKTTQMTLLNILILELTELWHGVLSVEAIMRRWYYTHTHYLFELLTQNWRLEEWHVASSASIFQA